MLTKEEVAAAGKRIYNEKLKALLEPEHVGEFLIIDVETGDYELDRDSVAAGLRLAVKNPSGQRFLMRVGYPAAYTMASTNDVAVR